MEKSAVERESKVPIGFLLSSTRRTERTFQTKKSHKRALKADERRGTVRPRNAVLLHMYYYILYTPLYTYDTHVRAQGERESTKYYTIYTRNFIASAQKT